MITFTKTRSAADYISRHTTSDLARSRALVLLKRLRVCEAALTATDGDPSLAHSLLRGLVLTVRELAGPAWLAANSDDPDIAAFTALASAPTPPPPAGLDELLARVLWARYAPAVPYGGKPGQPPGPGALSAHDDRRQGHHAATPRRPPHPREEAGAAISSADAVPGVHDRCTDRPGAVVARVARLRASGSSGPGARRAGRCTRIRQASPRGWYVLAASARGGAWQNSRSRRSSLAEGRV
jgi:hypothetical protein